MLDHAVGETKVLYAALSAREFDFDMTLRLAAETKRAIRDAKRAVDRSTDSLTEKQEKLRPEMKKLRDAVKAAEDQLAKVEKAIGSQVKPWMEAELEEEEEGESELADDVADKPAKAPPEPDWDLIKGGIGWLYVDLSKAQSLHGRIAKKVKMPRLRTPPKPKGSRN